MNPINKAIEAAKQSPNSQYATELRRRIESGQLDKELSDAGLSTQYNRPPNIGSRIKETIGDVTGIAKDVVSSSQKRADNITEIKNVYNNGEQGAVRSGLQTVGQLAGAGADAIGAVFKGAGNVLLSDKHEKDITDIIGKFGAKVMANPTVQEIVNNYNAMPPEKQRDLDAVGGVVSLVSNFIGGEAVGQGAKVASQGVKTGLTTGTDVIKSGITKVATGVTEKIAKTTANAPEVIMNKIARLNPKELQTFKKMTGKTPGEYLSEKGNFNAPDQIVTNEAETFAKTLADKEATISKLPGVYKDSSIKEALGGLLQKATATSSGKVKSPYLSEVEGFIKKYNSDGLSMEEINKVKKLYERNVKLGYNKLMNGDKVEQATNIDNALRKFQDTKAKELGFTNIDDLSKQIQASKFIVDKLGDKLVGQNALNGVSLTDYVILAGGDPTAVGSFLTKKIFSNKSVQAKIAKMLSKGETKKPVVSQKKITSENINRQINPQGFLSLPEGKTKIPTVDKQINLRGKSEIEPQAKKVRRNNL